MPRASVTVAMRSAAWGRALPRVGPLVRRVVGAVLADRRVGPGRPAEVGVVLADDAFVRKLNRAHRGKDKPTNVLSFPLGRTAPAKDAPLLLGDVVLALRTIRREARAEGKRLDRHAAHLLVHGTLHLLGFDHGRAAAAKVMEAHEVRILAGLGVPDPYRPPVAEARAR